MPQYNSFRTGDDDTEGKLFVGGLAWDSTEESIKEYFEKFGTVQEVNLKRNKEDPSKHRGFCFVKFSTQEFADSVLSQSEPHFIDGSKVDPKSVCPPGVKPEQRTKKIFVGGLQDSTTDEAMREYFSQFGQIQNNIEFATDRNTGKRRGFCFVEFANENIVDRIVKSKYHTIAGARVETKRLLTKAQQAEEAARQSAIHTLGSRPSPYTSAIQSLPAASAYGQSRAPVHTINPYGQQVIYIHPDSLSTMYPQSAIGGYHAAAAVPGAAYSTQGLSASYSTQALGTTYSAQTLYQPYTGTSSAVARGGSTLNVKRQAPYTLKKY